MTALFTDLPEIRRQMGAEMIVDPASPLANEFWSRVQKGDGCWIWKGCAQKRPGGAPAYGLFSLGKRGHRALAHRFAYALTHGPVAAGLVVCHRCDNPRCVRPDHLFIGSQAENLADMRAKGRAHFNRFSEGVAHPNAKINPETVKSIRDLRANGLSFASIGAQVGLHASTVHDIATGKTWRHVR